MNVLIVDDEKLVSSLINIYLKENELIDSIYSELEPSNIMKIIQEKNIKIIFLDLYLPSPIGFDILQQIKTYNNAIKVIILSSHFDGNYVDKAIEMGADAYLTKNIEPNELNHCINMILNNKVYLSSECKNSLYYKNIESEFQVFDIYKLKNSLTEREIEILKYIAEGLNTTEISEKIFISQSTIDFHKKSLFKKFGTNKSTKMVKIAAQNNII